MRQLSSYAPRFSVQRFALRFGLAYELLHEFGNVVRRIEALHNISADEQGLETIRIGEFPNYPLHVLRQAHNSGIQNIRKRYPWMSAFDVELFQQGFRAAMSFHDTLDKGESQTAAALSSPKATAI
jgi:hypothetical protein